MSTILGFNADLGAAQIEDFLYFSANAASLRSFFAAQSTGDATPQHTYFFDPAKRTASYASVATGRVYCLNVLNVSKDAADAIESQLDTIARMSLVPFQDVVEAVLGESINPQHPIGTYISTWWKP